MALKLDNVGKPLAPIEFSYDKKDVMLYNIGIGATELKYVYENGGLKVIPSFAVVPPFTMLAMSVAHMGANPMTLLHGEQTIIIKKPELPLEADLVSEGVVTDVWDKGDKGAVYVMKTTTKTKDGEELFDNIFSIFCRGDGGFDGDKGPKAGNIPPDRDPDVVHEETVPANQNLVYRLSGDINPLHVDPNFAKMAGFDKPILHGLCTFGYVARAVIEECCDNDSEKLKEYAVRFRGVLYPGEKIVTSLWKEGDKVFIDAKTGDGRQVIANAAATIG